MQRNPRGPLVVAVSLAAALCSIAPASFAQSELEGTYDISATVVVVDAQVDEVLQNEEGCTYTGTATLVYEGDGVVTSDDVNLSLDPATGQGEECLGELTGTLDGNVSDSTLTGTLDGGQLGSGEIEGTITDTGGTMSPSPRPPFSIGGSLNVNRGPNAGSSSTFTATQLQPMPFFGPLALALLTLILLAAGSYLLLRRRAA